MPVRSKGLGVMAALVVVAMAIDPSEAPGANPPAGATIVINEVLASNSRSGADPQGEYEDWIELHNPGSAPVNVGGMYLTDDPDQPTQWQFPTHSPALTMVPARGYLLVWADGEVGDGGLHASFKLSAGGDRIILYDRDGATLIDSVSFGSQRTDMSYGRLPDAGATWSLLTVPTPGGPNLRLYEGFVEKPRFSVRRGFYDGEILVSITCPTEGASIYYTTDGSSPYATGNVRTGAAATLYAGPVRLAKTTCLRATAIKTGWYPSPTETNTYIFVKDVITQSPTGAKPGPAWPSSGVNGQVIDYGMDPDVVNDPRYRDLMDDALLAIPSISLVTDLANLFDPQQGIYVNALNLGPAWERPVSVELIYPDGTEGFQIDAGVRIRGGYSRADGNPKHAFRLFFDAQYGAARLRYPLFGAEGVREFEGVDLRTSQNYSWSYEGGNNNSHDTFVREVFSRDTQRDMGQPYTRSRYYHLYLNGQYWGVFQTQERSEASYAESYFGGDREHYDVIKSRGGGGEGYDIEATDGTLDAWRRLWDAAGAGFDDDSTYYRVQGLNPDGMPNPSYPKLLDIDNLIDYMLCTYYVGDPDGPVSAWARVANNFFAIYNRVDPDGFKFFRHDGEHSLYDLQESRLFAPTTTAVGSSFNQSNPLWMHTHLMTHPEYRMRFADRVYKYFFHDGVLTPRACTDRFLARVRQIEMAVIAESARWGDSKRAKPRTKDDDWLPDINRVVTTYLPARTGIVLNQFKSQGWWPNVDPPSLSLPGGHVAAGFSLQMGGAGTIYYTLDGTDPRLPQSAGRTVGTQTLVPESAPKRVLVPTRDIGTAWKDGGPFDDSAWTLVTGAPGGVGYERSSGYQPYLSLDLGAQMYNQQATCYIRIPFAGADTSYTSLLLKIRYDDGFIAYLNGTEVARRNFTGTPRWNSVGSTDNPDAAAVVSTPIDVSAHANLLRPGANLLALHGLNGTIDSSDMLISAELVATKAAAGSATPAGVAASARRYTEPIVLSLSTHVKARTLSGTTWSALTEAVFAVGPVAEGLRVSEIMYHPPASGNPDDPNTEFIELTNIAGQSINLNLVRFTQGIRYTFPSFSLPPGSYCLVVKDLAAFEAKYGTKLPVVGQYTGGLDNGGERIELVDAAGQSIQSFQYEDNWYKSTDGQGFSLTVQDPKTSTASSLNEKTAWQAALPSPGRANP